MDAILPAWTYDNYFQDLIRVKFKNNSKFLAIFKFLFFIKVGKKTTCSFIETS